MNPNREFVQTVEDFVKDNPSIIIGGSYALYLHGVNMSNVETSGDLDIIVHSYTKFSNADEISQEWDYNCDFDYAVSIPKGKYGSIKTDVRIDNKARYDIVKKDDVEFKVARILDILSAKVKYAKSSKKHQRQLLGILNYSKSEPTVVIKNNNDLPF